MADFNIGADGQVSMGSAAAPTVLVDKTEFITGFSFDPTGETVDVTTLTPAAYARRFIAALNSRTGNLNYLVDSPAGNFFILLHDIIVARAKIQFRYRPFGSATGRLQITFDAFVTGAPLPVELATPVGGTAPLQITGSPTVIAQ